MLADSRYRFARPADLDAVKAVAKQNEPFLGFITRGTLERAIAEHKCVVIEQAEQVKGFCFFHFRRDRVAVIYSIAIATESQRGGLGGELMRRFCEMAKFRRQRSVRLKVIDGTPACAFYERHGFATVSMEPSKRVNVRVMVKPLVG